ncbi:MAG: response regulator transcription factor, partial [Xylophilus sp.]|nr:response regulator transcription factor [Xylophilus sp.]MBP7420444.1 response regulator transcription factor [Burkholderiaceae bacterium]
MTDTLSPLIHLIDDDEAVRSSLALLIGTVGLRVQTWADPLVFLAQFERQSIGAIVLDVRMPGTSGLTVLDTLVAQGVDQPVIMLTGHGTVEMCRRAFKAGAAEFLEKPVDDEALIEALQNAVRQHVKSR